MLSTAMSWVSEASSRGGDSIHPKVRNAGWRFVHGSVGGRQQVALLVQQSLSRSFHFGTP